VLLTNTRDPPYMGTVTGWTSFFAARIQSVHIDPNGARLYEPQ